MHLKVVLEVGVVTRLRTGGSGIRFRTGVIEFLFTKTFTPTLRFTHLCVWWLPEFLAPRVKRQGLEFIHLPPTIAKIKNEWSHTAISNIGHLHLTFTLP